ncbi:MAG: DNA translocase FtsK [Chloroflexi bacterium]|nr:DNA translocase FtsK [Chloroflexota bacterium]
MTKVRSRPRPKATGKVARSRPGRPNVGRRRSRPSPLGSLGRFLFRLEAIGITLVALAVISVLWLVPATRGATDLRDGFVRTFGLMVFAIIGLVAYLGLAVVRRRLDQTFSGYRPWLIAVLLAAFASGLLGFFRPDWQLGNVTLADITAGGDLGYLMAGSLIGILAWIGLGLAAFAIITPSGAEATALNLGRGVRAVWRWGLPVRAWRSARALSQLIFPTRRPPQGAEKVPLDSVIWAQQSEPKPKPPAHLVADAPAADEEPPPPEVGEQAPLPLDDEETGLPRKAHDGWQLPVVDLLRDVNPQDGQPDNAARARLIIETLASFGVDARVVQVNEGPTVTQFGIEPGWEIKTRRVPERDGAGRPLLDRDGQPKVKLEETSRTRVRVNQITSLSNDLALALAAPSLRLESPVPGKPFVGIEVPNHTAALVTLRSVIESRQFKRLSDRSRLTLALGQSVSGEPSVADLAKMPHLLIAGATGSGKSVCINAIIACVLMHASPEEVRFVMIDPKRVELAAFAAIPHLAFSSIITEMDQVVGTLQAVIHEMESRYRRFAQLGVRDIETYNSHESCPSQLPYWVVIIDELADLMMAAPYEVERQLCRLAQLARATGIHLIVATQRPSVDVVTGLIKANFPTRIAFAMSSQVDSRTILDSAGAEKLLGRGDMLFMPTDAAKPRRLQGVFVSDQEVEQLVQFWTQDRFQDVEREVFDNLLDEAKDALVEAEEEADPMLSRAIELAREHRTISTSMLQRRLRIGYPRAARVMDDLEERGIVGPAEGQGSREVLIDDNTSEDEAPADEAKQEQQQLQV